MISSVDERPDSGVAAGTIKGTIDFNEFLELLLLKMSEKDSKEDAMRAFRQFDLGHTGHITFDNLKQVARELGESMTDEEIGESNSAAHRANDGLRSEDAVLRMLHKGVAA